MNIRTLKILVRLGSNQINNIIMALLLEKGGQKDKDERNNKAQRADTHQNPKEHILLMS